MLIEMEILARERYERGLREAEELNRHHSLTSAAQGRSRGPRTLPLPRMRRR
jgi:hypothetical protein